MVMRYIPWLTLHTTVQGLKVTMKKHPSNFKLCGHLVEKLKTVKNEVVVLYEGEATYEKPFICDRRLM